MCKIIGLETDAITFRRAASTPLPPGFSYLSLSPRASKSGIEIYCIGQPGAEDLESAVPGTKKRYNLFEISNGRFRGLVNGQDLSDNERTDCLMHDAWTYLGYSGAPLFKVVVRREMSV